MSETRNDKIKRLYEFARGVREHGASVEIDTEHGKKTHEPKPSERGGVTPNKSEDSQAGDAA